MPRTVFNDNTLVDRAQGLWELFVGTREGGRSGPLAQRGCRSFVEFTC